MSFICPHPHKSARVFPDCYCEPCCTMNGGPRIPKHTELADNPISIAISKGPWWKYSHSAPRSSPPPRLLLVFLLLAQVLFLAIVRLGSVWTLSSTDGLPSTPVHMHHPVEVLPQRVTESAVFQEPSISSFPSSHFDSTHDPQSSVDNESLLHVGREEPTLNAAAMATSIDAVVKKEQTLIAAKVLENQGISDAKLRVEAQHKAHELATLEGHAFTEVKASEMIKSTDKDEQRLYAELVATASHDDAHNVETLNILEEVGFVSECKYGYLYVYDLPPMYNRDIIANCTALNVFLDVCDTLLNGGLGSSLGDASPLGQVGSWFRSDQFTAEIVFHKRMLQHPCLTHKPEQASSFYVPYYAGLDVGRYLWGGFSAKHRDRLGNLLLKWLVQQPSWKRHNGWGHFLMIGRITWDFRRSKNEDWGSGFFYHPSMQNVTRLLIEKNPWDYTEMAVPYPTNFHPQSNADLITWQNHIRGLKRSSLFSFAGAPRSAFPNDFRSILLDQCNQAQSCQSLDCSNRTCDNNQKTLELFMDSNFCLQPRGDSFTRRSTFDCLLAGSIPVFFWHRTAYLQYKWHLPENVESYSVFISKEAARNGTRIEDVLSAISLEKVREMREIVVEMVPRIVYAASGLALKEHRDAFDVAIEGVMKRFKELSLSLQRRRKKLQR